MSKRKKRGPYKKYLKTNDEEIPEATIRSRKKYLYENVVNSSDSDGIDSSDSNDQKTFHVEQENIDYCIECSSKSYEENKFSIEINEIDAGSECGNFNSASDSLNSVYDDFEDSNISYEKLKCNLKMQHLLPDKKLYDDCELSRAESEMLILSFSLRHKLTNVALEDLLNLIDCHLPHDEYKSKYRFLKSFSESQHIEYYYCPDCPNNLDFSAGINRVECSYCKKIYLKKQLYDDGYFFYYLRLKSQLIELMESKLYLDMRKECEESDVINSELYKRMKRRNVIAENDITIQWNTDGVSLFKTSNRGVTPVIVTVNELPYRIRKNNAMLTSLFYGNKPPMNVYLEPFCCELKELSLNGFKCIPYGTRQEITVKVHTILASVDSIARPQEQNKTQHNGKFGCSYCYHPGNSMPVGRGYSRMYCGSSGTPRSKKQYLKDAKLAIETDEIIRGIKGPSIVGTIPNFDVIHGFPPDYMHSCLLGVGKLFVTEWFDSKNNEKKWYMGLKLHEVNERLLAIKPPTEITRVPRGITESKLKASELKNIILYYSIPCLYGLLPKNYLEHWLLFVFSMNIFSKKKIADHLFLLAEKALYQFVEGVERLYGKQFMKYNVHMLLHIPLYIKKYGALWAWSAFPYEHFNGVIQHLFHGTQSIFLQICRSYNKIRNIRNNFHIFGNPNCSDISKDQFISLMNHCRIQHCIEYDNDLRVFGKGNMYKLSLNTKVVVEQYLQEEVEEDVKSYHRFIYKQSLFHTTEYDKLIKRHNSTVITYNNELIIINDLLLVRGVKNSNEKYIVLGTKLESLNQKLCKNGAISSDLFSYVARITSEIISIELPLIKRKCVMIPLTSDKWYIVPLVNNLETD